MPAADPAAYQRLRRQGRVAAASRPICITCLIREPQPGRKTCADCMAAIQRGNQARRRQYRAGGRCGRCGREPLPGRRQCHRCALVKASGRQKAVERGIACPLDRHWCQDEAAMTIFRRLYTS